MNIALGFPPPVITTGHLQVHELALTGVFAGQREQSRPGTWERNSGDPSPRDSAGRHAPTSSSGLSFLVRESGSPEPPGRPGGLAARMSAKISAAGRDSAAQSTASHRGARSSPVKRPLSPGKWHDTLTMTGNRACP